VELTVIDAGVLIGALDADDLHHPPAVAALQESGERGDQVVIPASAFAEAMVDPTRRGGSAVDAILGLVARLPVDVEALDAETAVIASGLRARFGRKLKLPDALVVATARRIGAGVLVTTDRGWPTASELGYPGQLVVL
jgi:predicted nucleic acid-binding protein